VVAVDAMHRLIAYVAIPAVAAGLGWSVLLSLAGKAGGAAFERFPAAVVSLLIVGGVSGLILLATGARPARPR
jgi:hypothetical protein